MHDTTDNRAALEELAREIVRCRRCPRLVAWRAPPANKPTPEERDNCREYLERELQLLEGVKVILALGGYAFAHVLRLLRDRGVEVPVPAPKFAHGAAVRLPGSGLAVIASYHPSQQNTFTGKLTPKMLDRVLARARTLAAHPRQKP